MTLVVVLLFGFGAVLVVSAIQTDPKTGKSVSVLQTIEDVWNNKTNFSQGGEPGDNGGGVGEGEPGDRGPKTAAQLHVANYLNRRQV